MILELIVGLLVLAMLAFAALFLTRGTGKRKYPSGSSDEGIDIPRNKANMDQPQEEFIAHEGAHPNADEQKNR